MADSTPFADALQKLEGEQLSSVEFVQDYVQLRFDGPCLNVYNRHCIRSAETTIAWRDPCYCDALCKPISHLVQKASTTSEEISLTFDNGVIWAMSLRDEDYRGPEAYNFIDQEGNFWVD